jgi:putative NIF3 family GTP cyclohydrolase 1 type 2
LKAITLENTQQNTLLRLAQEGISVYSPHTAVDAAPGGLNDWLADVVIGKNEANLYVSITSTISRISNLSSTQAAPLERSVISPVKEPPKGFEEAGYGRIVRFSSPQPLETLMSRIKIGLSVQSLSIAVPQSFSGVEAKNNIRISSVGICVGSGSMLNGLDVDLLVTGELSHHEALAAIENSKCVITTFHSNSERGFLRQRMNSALEKQLNAEIAEAEMEGAWEDGLSTEYDVAVSKVDRDPYLTAWELT